MKAVIIEDEDNSREFLKNAINKFIPSISVIGEASGVKTGVDIINNLKPELVYLDVELSDGSGFSILEKIKNKNINVIFTTAFENYAIKAYRYSAIDYLLKPLSIDELKEATQRAMTNKENNDYRLAFLQSRIKALNQEDTEILIDTKEQFVKVELDNIMAFQADSGITTVVLKDRPKIISAKSLKFYEDLLNDKNFIRIHRSHVVNLNMVTNVDKTRLGNVTMQDGSKYEFAARKKSLILNMINIL